MRALEIYILLPEGHFLSPERKGLSAYIANYRKELALHYKHLHRPFGATGGTMHSHSL